MSALTQSLLTHTRLTRAHQWLGEESPSEESWRQLLESLQHASSGIYNGLLLLRWVQDQPQQVPPEAWAVLYQACSSLPLPILEAHSGDLKVLLERARGDHEQDIEALLGDMALLQAQPGLKDLGSYPAPLRDWAWARLRVHLQEILAWATSGQSGAWPQAHCRARLYPSNLLHWWRASGQPLPEPAPLERILTWERHEHNISRYWVNPQAGLLEVFLTFPEEERVRMLMDGQGPLWLLPTIQEQEPMVRTLQTMNTDSSTRYHLFQFLEKTDTVDWRAPLLQMLPTWPWEYIDHTCKWLQLRDPREHQGLLLRALAQMPLERLHWLHGWLLGWLTTDDFLPAGGLWGQASEAAREPLARVLIQWVRQAEHADLLERLRARWPQDPWWDQIQARAFPDWVALARQAPFWEPLQEDADPETRLLAQLWDADRRDHQRRASHFYQDLSFSGRATVDLMRRADAPGHDSLLRGLWHLHKHNFLDAAQALLRHHPIKPLRDLYLFCMDQGLSLPPEIHFKALEAGTSQMQSVAAQRLAEQGQEALPQLLALLQSKKAAARGAAARALALMEQPDAAEPLRQALGKERSAKIKPLLEAALEVCDPARLRLKEMARQGQGFYRLGQALELRQALEELRAILYEAPTAVSWMRLCDLLQRLDPQQQLQPALDYLKGHNLERWPQEQRLIPWGWDRHPGLASLGQPGEGEMTWWVPISLLRTQAREAFLDEVLPQIQKRAHRRKLPRDQVDLFLAWVEKSWFWCQDNDIPVEELEVRLDGGAYQGMSRPESTCLELRHGFAVSLARLPCYTGETANEGLRWARVPLPRGHLLRSRHQLKPYHAHLRLDEILAEGSDQP